MKNLTHFLTRFTHFSRFTAWMKIEQVPLPIFEKFKFTQNEIITTMVNVKMGNLGNKMGNILGFIVNANHMIINNFNCIIMLILPILPIFEH